MMAMNGVRKRAGGWSLTRPWAALFLSLASCVALFGCSASAGKDQIATTSKPEPSPHIAQPAKGTTPQTQVFNLQELAVREDRGQTTLFVRFSQPVTQFRHFPLPQPSRIVLDILDDMNRLSEVETFRIDTNWVATLRLSSISASLRLTVDVAAATVPPYTIVPENGGLKIVIGSLDSNATAKKHINLVQGGKRTDIRPVDTAFPMSGEIKTQAFGADPPLTPEKKYTGQKLSLEFKDADIKNVLRLLAEVSGKNIVVTDDVNRKVTIRLMEVPWDQAMDLLINTNGLDKEEVGNVIRISTAGRLKSERDALAAAKKSEENLEPLETAYLTVNYARVIKGKDDKDVTDKDLVEKIKTVLSPRGTVVADQRTNKLIVRDIKKGIEDAQSFIAKLDVRTPQVLIESNLIETTPTFSRALGVEMEALFNGGRVRTSTRFPAGAPFEGSPQPTPETNQLIIPNTGFRFGYFGNNVTSILSAAEAEGDVKIISRPSVVTLNNVESMIESANIIRVRTQPATVGEAGSVIEIRAGIILTVTPQVSADGFVLLRIAVKSSTLDFGRVVENIPQENTREAKANVLVRDGETVVIGGILRDESSTSDSGIPYLKDIPVLGWLFKKSSWQKDFQELVVFITPRIIEAGSENLPSAEQLWREQLKQTQGATPLRSKP
jgi:type IV pilus assembly protein PilQ